ncbi:helix-turn-helix domain-containing protein [Dictyobacter kobayashii]|uniref:Helix-turn-helix domain-containing protein n=1 Tax=Dictyobacter kobayashii TaxID=2014872 RepID=A0A402AKJ6_9CHLR|nr:helix-turn-helix domain-containing protein [Dictyobacter kobayashii]GCE19545.1 hypothetical protein KDK_33450 [Dictyobacter kobayashii]
MQDEMLTAKEVSQIMKVNIKTVREWVASGDLKAIWIGKREYRISRQDLNAFIEKRKQPPEN